MLFRSDEEPGEYDELPFFASKDSLSLQKVDINQVKERLRKILPDYIDIKFIDEFVGALANNAITYGLFKNSIIYLGREVPKGVEYHEAFHAVFRILLNPAQRVKVLQEAVSRYGKPTSEQLDELRSLNDKYSNLSLKELTNLWYEEKLADEFMDLMNNKTEPAKEKSFLQKILDFLKKIVNLFKNSEPEVLSEIDGLFNSIKGGKFRNAKPVSIIDNNLSVFSSLKYSSTNEDNKPISKFQNADSTKIGRAHV